MHGVPDRIREALLTDEPDLVTLEAEVARELDLEPVAARAFVRDVVAAVNTSLFPPVAKLELIHTEGCNLACTYCFEKNMLGWRRMPPEIALAGVDLLFRYSGTQKELRLLHFGGEPLLNYGAVQQVTEYAERRAIELDKTLRFDMTSNGVLLDEERCAWLAEHKVQVLLSVDGLRESHDRFRVDPAGRGSFDAVMRGFAHLKRAQRWVGTKMTIMPENAGRLDEDVRGLHDLGFNQFLLGHATGVEWPEEALEAYSAALRRLYAWYRTADRSELRITEFDEAEADEGAFFGCQAGRVSVTVSVSGELSPCSKVLALDNRRPVGRLGDVRWGITHLRHRLDLVSADKARVAAEEAGIAGDYRGGCYAVNHQEHGSMYQPSLQEHRISGLTRAACSGCSGCG